MSEDIKKNPSKKKKKYQKPSLKSEKIMVFGAQCNGSTNGGRKASAVPGPAACVATKLLS